MASFIDTYNALWTKREKQQQQNKKANIKRLVCPATRNQAI